MNEQVHYKALNAKTVLDNRYEILSILGSGGFGITYLANFTKLGSKVVIKEYFPNDLAHRDTSSTIVPFSTEVKEFYDKGKERFLLEAQTIVKFKHPNIVKVIDYFETNNTAYFVMDYEEGEDLGIYLKKKQKLNQEEILNIIMPILDGLREVHSHDVYHRDIKPDNIYLRDNGSPMLIDFGAAKQLTGQDGSKASSFNPKTASYAAPEQKASIAKYIGPYTDIYAIGAVLHYIVTNTTPPTADDRSISRDNEGIDNYKPLAEQNIKGYSKEFLSTIDWCLSFLSKNRPQSVKELQNALMSKPTQIEEPQKEEEPVKKPQPPKQEVPKEEKQQNKLLPIIIGIVILIAGIVFYQIQHPQKVWKDPETNLMWQVKVDEKPYDWYDAERYCKNLSCDKYNDWRLPTKDELDSIVTEEMYKNPKSLSGLTYIKKPLLNSMNMKDQFFWSNSVYKNQSLIAWYVYFYNGSDNYRNKSNKKYVRCVRGGQ